MHYIPINSYLLFFYNNRNIIIGKWIRFVLFVMIKFKLCGIPVKILHKIKIKANHMYIQNVSISANK